MMNDSWLTLKKGPVGIHLAYDQTFTNNLSASDFQTRISNTFEISLDLNKNLQTKNKLKFSYIDAQQLAEGMIDKLKLIQIFDQQIIGLLAERVKAWGMKSTVWLLRVHLNGEHLFRVKAESREAGSGEYLSLRVVGGKDNVVYLRPRSK